MLCENAFGTAVCCGCGEKIEAGEVRVGVEAQGEFVPYEQWYHAQCYYCVSGDKRAPQQIPGYNSLGAADQQALCDVANCVWTASDADPVAESAAPGAWTSLGSTACDGSLVDDEYREAHDVLYGEATVTVVGTRYFEAGVHAGELVTLTRKLLDEFGSYTIRVDKLQGQPLGHILPTTAFHLAQIMDDSSPSAVKVDALCPRTKTSALIKFWGLPEHFDATRSYLEAAGIDLYGGLTGKERPQNTGAGSGVVAASPANTKEGLDDEYQALAKQLAEADTSKIRDFFSLENNRLKTELMPHQVEAVAFMTALEGGFKVSDAAEGLCGHDASPRPLPPLWEERIEDDQTVYSNKATILPQEKRPPHVRGGFLCDEMGLGKTLSVLALVVARDSRPSAIADQSLAAEDAASVPEPSSSSGRTLVVCPASVLSTWEREVGRHTYLKVNVYHGPKRELDADADIVLTTYGVLRAEFSPDAEEERPASPSTSNAMEVDDESNDCGGLTLDMVRERAKSQQRTDADDRKQAMVGELFATDWRRVVLDEAHTIRNRKTKTFGAAMALETTHAWCVTGTPMVNRVDDFQPLLAFVKCMPVDDASTFGRAIARPIRERDQSGLALLRLLIKYLSLRRTKAVLVGKLPPLTNKEIIVTLQGDAREAYDVLFKTAKVAIEGLGEDALKSYPSILECLLRLRQVTTGVD